MTDRQCAAIRHDDRRCPNTAEHHPVGLYLCEYHYDRAMHWFVMRNRSERAWLDRGGPLWAAEEAQRKADRKAEAERIRLQEASAVVYFVRRVNGDIKIGYSAQLNVRLKTLAREFGPVELLGGVQGARQKEAALHLRFGQTRIDGTEWFGPSDDLLDFISACCPEPYGMEVKAS